RSSAYTSKVSALRRSGRLSVTNAIAPSSAYSKVRGVISDPRDAVDLHPRAGVGQRTHLDERDRGIVGSHAPPIPLADRFAGGRVFVAAEDEDRQLANRFGIASGRGDDGQQVRERLVELILEAIARELAGAVPSDLAGDE